MYKDFDPYGELRRTLNESLEAIRPKIDMKLFSPTILPAVQDAIDGYKSRLKIINTEALTPVINAASVNVAASAALPKINIAQITGLPELRRYSERILEMFQEPMRKQLEPINNAILSMYPTLTAGSFNLSLPDDLFTPDVEEGIEEAIESAGESLINEATAAVISALPALVEAPPLAEDHQARIQNVYINYYGSAPAVASKGGINWPDVIAGCMIGVFIDVARDGIVFLSEHPEVLEWLVWAAQVLLIVV